MNRLFITSLFILVFKLNFSQSYNYNQPKEYIISGVISSLDNDELLEYATITLLNPQDKSVITGGISDNLGKFSIPVKVGTYDVLIEFISFKNLTLDKVELNNNIDLGKIRLELDYEALGEVEIIAEETTVEVKLDKKIYTVGRDLSVRGGNAGDVLDNIPSVSVDLEGNILLRGNDAARILINGKPSSLVGIDSKFLQQLPSDAIEKVEVITSPSARYEAQGSGGIINIILRKSKKLGLNGSLSSSVGDPKRNALSSNLNYRNGKLNFFNSSGWNDNLSPGGGYNNSEYYNDDTPNTFFEEVRERERSRSGYFLNNGIEWYLSDNTSIVGSFFYNKADSENAQNNFINQVDSFGGDILNQTIQTENEISNDFNREYNFNYETNFDDTGQKLTVDLQFDNSEDYENGDVLRDNELDEVINTKEESNSYLIKADYVYPIGDNKQFEAGIRISEDDNITDYKVFENIDSEIVEDLDQSNIFQYKEQINALYTQYGVKVEDKYSFLVGLRVENTIKDINQLTTQDYINKNETGLFPTFNFGLELDENETLTFGYNRRIRRPWSRFINPFPSKTSPLNIFRGNPDLNPTYSNNIDFGYLKRFESSFTINTSAYFQRSTDTYNFINQENGETVQLNGEEIPVVERFPINLSSNERFGFELNLSYRKGRKWNINSNFNLYTNKVVGSYEDLVFDNESLSWSFRLNNKLTLPGKIEWQTRMNYRGPEETAITKRDGNFSVDLAFSKELFNDNASLTFNVRDLLDQGGWKTETFNQTFYNDSEYRWRQRSYTLNFTYRFNQKKNQNRRQMRSGGYEDGAFDF
ncbi:MAG: TonB-dependent receptor [Bacteroidetes bacterium]|nr:MAG: TonB-dependent receptor [Bacteroidota bacterium]